ncbi:MAG: DUF5717 family protein [Lachnospiraceae bacterium]|nr:DUF5717 family protein [Lachnospiraceae bacterium]
MNTKINNFAKGIFDYRLPEFTLSDELIEIEIEEESVLHGVFSVCATDGNEFRGMAFSSDRRFSIDTPKFAGVNNEISYTIQGKYCRAGETVRGHVDIITNHGERILHYVIHCLSQQVHSSVGTVRDLFQFTNLAMENFDEATALFTDEKFETSVLHDNINHVLLRRGLLQAKDGKQALDEFLINVHKKFPVSIEARPANLIFNVDRGEYERRIVIRKGQWGYGKIRVTSSSPFIKIPIQEFTTDDFENNEYLLPVTIVKGMLSGGDQEGKIIFESLRWVKVVKVTVKQKADSNYAAEIKREIGGLVCAISMNYAKFVRGSLDPKSFHSVNLKQLDELEARCKEASRYDFAGMREHRKSAFRMGRWVRLYRSFLDKFYNDGKITYSAVLDSEGDSISNDKNSKLYAYSRKALAAIKRFDSEEFANSLDYLFEGVDEYPDDIRLVDLFYCVYDEVGKTQTEMYAILENFFERGNSSPILYARAYSLLIHNPGLAKKRSAFLSQIVNYALKNGILTSTLSNRFLQLIDREKCNDFELRLVERIYDDNKSRENLASLVKQLLRNDKTDVKYHNYYVKAIQQEVKQRGIFEVYLRSFDPESKENVLPEAVKHFSEINSITSVCEPYFYASLIREKKKFPKYYNLFKERMKYFANQSIKKGLIDTNYSTVYKDVFEEEFLDRELATTIPNVCFKYEVTSSNKDFKKAIIIHHESDEIKYYDIVDSKTVIDIYSEGCSIFFEDNDGNHLSGEDFYQLKRLFECDSEILNCYRNGSKDIRVILTLLEKSHHYDLDEKEVVALYKNALRFEHISKSFRKKCLLFLIRYYFDNYDGEILDNYLSYIELSECIKEERDYLIEMMLLRSMNEEAYEAVMAYGYEGIDPKLLFRMCSHFILTNSIPSEYDFVRICFYCYSKGKYDEQLLIYLADNYIGSTSDLYDIWDNIVQKEKVPDLERRLITQMLFSENYLGDTHKVFLSLYKKETDSMIVRAYLAYQSYKYIIKNRRLSKEFFEILKAQIDGITINLMEGKAENDDNYTLDDYIAFSRIIRLALIKYYSSKDKLEVEEREFSEFAMKDYCKRNVYFPFFDKFKGKCSIPQSISSKRSVTIQDDPKYTMKLYYRVVGRMKDYECVNMSMPICGMFISDFVLFYGEILQYYIIKEYNGQTLLFESGEIIADNPADFMYEDEFSESNMIFVSEQLHDEKSRQLYLFNEDSIKELRDKEKLETFIKVSYNRGMFDGYEKEVARLSNIVKESFSK